METSIESSKNVPTMTVFFVIKNILEEKRAHVIERYVTRRKKSKNICTQTKHCLNVPRPYFILFFFIKIIARQDNTTFI